jgi:hypothetical protein
MNVVPSIRATLGMGTADRLLSAGCPAHLLNLRCAGCLPREAYSGSVLVEHPGAELGRAEFRALSSPRTRQCRSLSLPAGMSLRSRHAFGSKERAVFEVTICLPYRPNEHHQDINPTHISVKVTLTISRVNTRRRCCWPEQFEKDETLQRTILCEGNSKRTQSKTDA